MRPVLTENGEQALAEMQRELKRGTPFPLVLLDSQMPQFDGFELAQAIKSAPALDSATIMMLSSSDLLDEIARCKALGITRFLRKPIKQSELFDAIVAAMGIAPANTLHAKPEVRPMPSRPARILNVLVAEDHPINQKLVMGILSERGHSFAIAGNGAEALQLLERQSFDVILMDGQMPEMDGYQATREIRRREQSTGKHIRIIAVTAHAMKQDRDMCLAAGMDDYVSKPVDPDELLERLEGGHENSIPRFPEHATAGIEKPTASKAFDLDSALKRARGKHALLKQLAEVFLQELPNALAEIHTAIAANDASWLERSAHRLKGAAINLSAEPVAHAAGKLEQFGRNKEFDQVREYVHDLQARALELAAALEALTGDAA
jgi:CheY-like chemotaxis protein